ncbi:TPA: hypothetical protein N0F65_002013, partial [Lagenidium giganteum]
GMEVSVDTLVYQLEDDDAQIRLETLQKLRKIAAVESSHFPVRNPRRFLQCVRRRIADDDPRNAREALRLAVDVMPVLGSDLDQVMSSILPHLVVLLPSHLNEAADVGDEGLHGDAFQVFRKYALTSNDIKSVVDLLLNQGLAHDRASVREASITAVMRLLDERYAPKTTRSYSKNRMDRALFVTLVQTMIPAMEDENESVVVAAEEALAKLQTYWDTGLNDVMAFLSSEDQHTLQAHQTHIDEFLHAAVAVTTTPTTPGGSAIPPRALGPPLRFGFVDLEVVDVLTANMGLSNADWKKRSVAVEKLYTSCTNVDAGILQQRQSSLEELIEIVVRLLQDADIYIVKRALQMIDVLFAKIQEGPPGTTDDASPSSVYIETLMPVLVETAANFAEDQEMARLGHLVVVRLFQHGFASVARVGYALVSSLQHRRLQVREEALKFWITLLLVAQQQQFSTSRVLGQSILHALGRVLGDSSTRIRQLALEAAAVVDAVTNTDVCSVLQTYLDESVLERIDLDALRRRLQHQRLPVLHSNGILDLNVDSKDYSLTSFVTTTPFRRSVAIHADQTSPLNGPEVNTSVNTNGHLVERSLSNASEMRVFDARASPPDEYENASFSRVRQSRSVISQEVSPATNPNSTNGCGIYDGGYLRQPVSERSVGTTAHTKTVSPVRGSLSDRSYFPPGSETGYVLDSKIEPAPIVPSDAIADKLSMLKRKTAQLRKSTSSRRISPREPLTAIGNSDNSEMVRSKSSPIRFDGNPEEPAVSDIPHSAAFAPYPAYTTAKSSPSPQKLQELQSEAAHIQFEDRPIVSKYIQKTPQKHQELHGEGSKIQFEDRPIVSRFIQQEREQLDQQDGESALVPLDDRPIRPAKATTLLEFPSADAPQYEDNGTEKPRGKRPMSLATKKRLEAKQKQGSASDPIVDASSDDVNDLIDGATQKPMSLATRRRVETRMRQEMGLQAIDSARNANDEDLSGPVKKGASVRDKAAVLDKKGKAAAGAGNDARPSAFAKQDAKYLEPHEIKPLTNPKQEISKLANNIHSDDWEIAFEALSSVRRAAAHHAPLIEDKVHVLTTEILKQVPNLRSSVAKNACLALESLCNALGKQMDSEVDSIVAVLIKRSGDSNAFVCEMASLCISAVILNCSTSKVVNALVPHLSARAVPIRREVARGIHTVIASLADQVQSCKEMSSIMAIVGKCLEDSNNEVRDVAKQSLLYLQQVQHFDSARLKRFMQSSAHSRVDQVLSSAGKYTPPTVGGASAADVGLPDRIKKLSSKATADGSTGVVSKKVPIATTSAADTEALTAILKKLDSSNWKDRFDALTEVTTLLQSTGAALCDSGKILAVFDVLLKRMEDGNAKVNVLALECLEKIVPALGNGMELVLSNFVPALAKNLAASNMKLMVLAQAVVHALCTHVEVKLLCQHLAPVARHANSRIKPFLVETFERLTLAADEKSHFALNRYVVPLALDLMKEAKSDVKDANNRLLRSLYITLGTTMHAAIFKLSDSQQEKLAAIVGVSSFTKR